MSSSDLSEHDALHTSSRPSAWPGTRVGWLRSKRNLVRGKCALPMSKENTSPQYAKKLE